MLKIFIGLSPEIIKGFFPFREEVPYNFKQPCQYQIRPVHTILNLLD